jgi:hypothetical protein
MTHDEFKLALLSSLESEHIGTLEEIDRRLREAKVLIEGYRIDPIVGYVAVKIDFLRSLRPEGDPIKQMHREVGMAIFKIVEKLFEGVKGYVVVTDSEMKIENIGGDDCQLQVGEEMRHISIQTTLNIEHTYVLKDGKYVCEWGDPKNPLHQPETLFERPKPTRTIERGPDGITMRYDL